MQLQFKPNVGQIDRLIRLFLGAQLLLLAFLFPVSAPITQTLIASLGLWQMIQGLLGYCFVYDLLGYSSLKAALK
ncbi:YgaP-like transmembrane domain [Heliorestis convoluta]|uniref:Inner membrane protein YgaP-like transmembrane domain-containing protein n=1 Tax=Heliorestis convoluta TaxID=356322 RepID=A0A5Q2N474_9FIRM|nr:YgaP-like transmembrane domain [Heliorestis convoluta]QGG49121.1 hypothetical protein FTV88_3046 [Heliorestis convoluta]